jgi:hypothetical protein
MRIDLNDYRTRGVHVFSGRDRGITIRKKLDLSRIDLTPETVTIIVPKDVFSVNSSFFQGLFGDSVRALGEDRFKQKYDFDAAEVIKNSIARGIKDALKNYLPIS